MPAVLGSLSSEMIRSRLASRDGLGLQTGPFTVRVRTRLDDVADAIIALYAGHPLAPDPGVFDFGVSIKRTTQLRTLWRPQVAFEVEGQTPFNPLRGDQGLPLLEWGLNWCVYASCHQYLILHAAVLEREGRALILPAPSGSGKSTLCAALAFNGWRLLSDELTLIHPADGSLVPLPRPVSLKNESIDVMARFVPGLQFGSRVSETTKGVVAHFKPPADALHRAHEHAMPAWVVLPRYVAGSKPSLLPLSKARGFMSLVENAFNYDVFGAEGFGLLGALVDRSECFSFEYSQLSEAMEVFGRLASSPAAQY